MGAWIHSNEYCHGKPRFGRRDGRRYECHCGRIWESRSSVDILGRINWRWSLIFALDEEARS